MKMWKWRNPNDCRGKKKKILWEVKIGAPNQNGRSNLLAFERESDQCLLQKKKKESYRKKWD